MNLSPFVVIPSLDAVEFGNVNNNRNSISSDCQQFHVYIVLDNREVKGSGKCRKRLMEFLEILGVPVMVSEKFLQQILFIVVFL